jgi:hypothetical protein
MHVIWKEWTLHLRTNIAHLWLSEGDGEGVTSGARGSTPVFTLLAMDMSAADGAARWMVDGSRCPPHRCGRRP